MKTPWFSILEVVELRGPSLADIARQVAEKHHVHVSHLVKDHRGKQYDAARREFYVRVREQRPDLTSSQVGRFIKRDGSTVRNAWRTWRPILTMKGTA